MRPDIQNLINNNAHHDYTNEIHDELMEKKTEYLDPKYRNNGGYSNEDIKANRLGQNFGDLLRRDPSAKPSDILK